MHAQNANGDTPLHVAAYTPGHEEIVTLLVEMGTDVQCGSTTTGKYIPLHHAGNVGLLDTVTVLIALGGSALAKDADGCTPLRHAERLTAMRQSSAICWLL